MSTYSSLEIETEGQVATIRMQPLHSLPPGVDPHWELSIAFAALRTDDQIRVVILTGAVDGEFLVAFPTESYSTDAAKQRLSDASGAWKTFMGIVRCLQTMAEMEKPIVACVNGDALGFGQSLMFDSDIIVAREDAKISDIHLGLGQVMPSHGRYSVGPPFGIVPGDGAAALVPLYMSPAKAKEYLMLSSEYTGLELAQAGIINYAVPSDQLRRTVDDIVRRLLERPAHALAWTKRLANRQLVQQLNLTLDAGVAYEMVNFLQIDKQGFIEKNTLA